MDSAALDGAIGAVGVASIASLFLPGIETLWDAHPADGEQKKRLRTGLGVYFLILASAGVLQSMRAKSAFPFVFVMLLGGVVAFTFERALASTG